MFLSSIIIFNQNKELSPFCHSPEKSTDCECLIKQPFRVLVCNNATHVQYSICLTFNALTGKPLPILLYLKLV